MKRWTFATLMALLGVWLLLAVHLSARAPAPVYVTLWFDTEDYLLPQDDDATKRLAELLTRLGVRATFKIVGEKARVLERRGRKDVIAALKRHDIGYHSNTHSQQPTIAVYLQNAGWEEGRAEFMRREAQGVKDIQRIFGVTPVAYGQPGSAWAPQTYPALRDMGIKVYLDEADQVGLDDQPFYLGSVVEAMIGSGRFPSDVEPKTGRFTSDAYVAEDSPKLWGWVIFPEGFHAPRIMELARLQSWTLKPALLVPGPRLIRGSSRAHLRCLTEGRETWSHILCSPGVKCWEPPVWPV